MDTNRIIIWTNPVAPFQKLYVMKDGVLIEQMGIQINDVPDIVFELAQKYEIQEIHFSGTRSYAEKIAEDLREQSVFKYNLPLNISIVI